MTSSASGPDGPGLGRRRLLAAAGCLALSACARIPGAAPGAGEVRERHYAAAGGTLRLLTAGEGRPVVLLHGASGNARDWTFGALGAIARRHAVLAFDRPGLGGSAAVAGHESPFVQAAAMAEATAGLGHRRPILVGHSYGGTVALAWALERPGEVAGVLLLGAPTQVWPGGMGLATELLAGPVTGPLLAAVSPAVPRAVPEAAVRRIFSPQAPPADYLDRLGLAEVLAPAALRANARQLAALKRHVAAMVPRYAALPVPVEVLHGDADGVVPIAIHAGPLAAQAPRARLTVLPGIGHMPHHAALPAVLAALGRLAAAA